MKRTILISLSIFFPLLLFSQKEEKENLYIIPQEYTKIHHEGEQALLMKRYNEALRQFKKVLKKFPDFPPAMRSAGACHELMGDYEQALHFYENAIESNPSFSRAMYYEVGNISYKCGRYEDAMKYFHQFDSLLQTGTKQFSYNGVEEREIEAEYLGKLDASKRACSVAMDSVQYWNITEVTNLGGGINTKSDEYFPFLTNDGNTLFYTTRKGGFADENLFVSEYNGQGWHSGSKVTGFNSKQNEGMTTLVRDGRNVFFTACQRASVLGTCDIWKGKVVGTEIYDIESTKGLANTEAWESQASISCDGSVLYFASNRKGGQGGTDIWRSLRLADGSWGEPTNLGKSINTSGDEEAPFISNDGKVLYFSSTGHMGLGEQDIFMSRLSGNDFWSIPVNLGMPVNSSYRELGFFLSGDGKTGYFASDRKGGEGGMDIYHFELPDVLSCEPTTFVEGYVQDSITRMPVPATVNIVNRQRMETDDEGRFFLCMEADVVLEIEVLHKDYYPYKEYFIIPEWDNIEFFTLDILLNPLFRLPVYTGDLDVPDATLVSLKSPFGKELKHNVLFDFDKSKLKVQSIKDLEVFMEEVYAEFQVESVEVVGYADDLGDGNYNFILSEKRAKEVGIFLKEKGIQVNKVYIEGKGATVNALPNWKNRRVEVVIHLVN